MPNAILNKRCVGNPYPNIAAQFVSPSTQSFTIADNASLSMGAGVRMATGAWINMDTLGANRTIIGKNGLGSGAACEYHIYYNTGTTRFEFRVSDGTTRFTANSTFGAPAVGVWYFVVGTYDGTNIRISVNAGAQDSTAFTNDIQDAAAMFGVGGEPVNASYMNGRIDCAFVTKKALSTAEITQLYNGGIGMAYRDLSGGLLTSLAGYWNFDGNGNDASGNGNTLTNNNAVTFAGGKR
jgi:hypothetical protein